VPTGTCAHGNNQFATNMAGQASRRWSIWTCRCAPSEHLWDVPGNGICAQDELRRGEVSEHSRGKERDGRGRRNGTRQATHHSRAAFPALGASYMAY